MTANGISVIRQGDGPEDAARPRGASTATTWLGLERLGDRWALSALHRRGYPPSPPPPGGRQDFVVDADNLTALLDGRPHVAAHSYDAVGALIAAARDPGQVRSLTLVEPALFLDLDDPEIARLKHLAEHTLTSGLDSHAATLREYLTVARAQLALEVTRTRASRRSWARAGTPPRARGWANATAHDARAADRRPRRRALRRRGARLPRPTRAVPHLHGAAT